LEQLAQRFETTAGLFGDDDAQARRVAEKCRDDVQELADGDGDV
jgi:hypothetical protein